MALDMYINGPIFFVEFEIDLVSTESFDVEYAQSLEI